MNCYVSIVQVVNVALELTVTLRRWRTASARERATMPPALHMLSDCGGVQSTLAYEGRVKLHQA